MTADQTYDSGADNSQPQVQPAKATQPADNYNQVATAPDGVPVYQNGGNYYTKNADNSYTQQFQGGAPSWLNPQGQPPQQSGGSGGTMPSYYNANDPVHQAVMQAYQAKGIQPRDASDFNYWVDHINQSGGLANGYANTGGSGTWAQRMAAGSGGVGDYSTGGGGSGAGGGVGGWGGAGGPDPRSQALYDQLLKRSTQSLAVNPNDPIIKGQTDAFNTTQQRQLRKGLSAAAEAAGPNGNIANETRMGNETAGEATAGFQANLMQKEVDARRAEIAQALSGQLGVLSLDQQAALHREDEALQARGQDIQSQLGNRGLANTERGTDNAANQQAWENQYQTLFG
jgi:hypothetical protein